MPEYVRLGSSPDDLGGVWDLKDRKNPRGMVRVNTGLIPHAIPLELIPLGPNNYKPGLVFFYRDWGDIYCLAERPGWIEQDYFDYAKGRFKTLGIRKP